MEIIIKHKTQIKQEEQIKKFPPQSITSEKSKTSVHKFRQLRRDSP